MEDVDGVWLTGALVVIDRSITAAISHLFCSPATPKFSLFGISGGSFRRVQPNSLYQLSAARLLHFRCSSHILIMQWNTIKIVST